MMRLNKFIAHCGVASRRNADAMIAAGRVEVNGEKVLELGVRVDESADIVSVDGRVIRPVRKFTYVVLNKPTGFLTSHSDPHHNKTVVQLVKDVEVRVNPVGRLDIDTTGVLLLTDDGELAHRLTHPRFKVEKVYLAVVVGAVKKSELQQFSDGITLPDGNIGHADAKIIEAGADQSDLKLTLTEGRKREVRHMCKAIGHPVKKLTRIAFAGITCDDVLVGKWRHLTPEEVSHLKRLTDIHD
ncbi:MAG: pseudouridine synthase [Candidatus Zixiibacteriota bacterium]